MLKFIVITIVILIVLPTSEGLRGRGFSKGSSKYDGKVPPKQGVPMGTGINGQVPNLSPARRGLGISAWGLITVIISLILSMAGMYYFSICYPVLCKKSRKYDMIGLPNVV